MDQGQTRRARRPVWDRQVRSRLRRRIYEAVRYPDEAAPWLHLRTLMQRLGISVVLDIGARRGDYGDMLRRIGYTGRIVSFEPVQENLDLLERRSREDPNWEVVDLALGSADESLPIYVRNESSLHSFRTTTEMGDLRFGAAIRVQETRPVKVRRLDGIFEQHVRPSETAFLKTDTQGWDHDVLRGAEGSLRTIRAIQIELSTSALYEGQPNYLETLAYLSELGYEPTAFFPVLTDADMRAVELDCVAVRVREAP